jgi:hypothetical protein
LLEGHPTARKNPEKLLGFEGSHASDGSDGEAEQNADDEATLEIAELSVTQKPRLIAAAQKPGTTKSCIDGARRRQVFVIALE